MGRLLPGPRRTLNASITLNTAVGQLLTREFNRNKSSAESR
jgi:hypothetical protein